MKSFHHVKAILFDLDGTLIDSAPDLASAANEMRVARGLPAYPSSRYRPLVGSGARGMVECALGMVPGDPGFAAARDEFLVLYESRMTQETRLFSLMAPVLERLAAEQFPWGIVTNKATRLAEPIVRMLGLLPPASVLVCGDTTPHSKPHPEPLLEAAKRMGVFPNHCIYVGDDLRDVQAGQAAGMSTAAAAWGYLGMAAPVEAWGADVVWQAPIGLLQTMRMD